MSTHVLNPLIHNPRRLRILATLAALPAGDELSVARLRNMIGLPEGGPIAHLGELAQAGYVRIGRTGGDGGQATAVLTRAGRAALDRYTTMVRHLAGHDLRPPAPRVRAGDDDRAAAAADLAEHFAQGRLTFDELSVRLDATLTATTHGDLYQAARDLPDLTSLPATARPPRGKRAARRSQGRRRTS